MSTASTTTAARLYVRRNPDHADSIELLHLTINPDNKVWEVHFHGDTTTAPPDLFSGDPRLATLCEAEQMDVGDFLLGDPVDVDEFHNLATTAEGDGDPWYGSGWTLMPAVPEH